MRDGKTGRVIAAPPEEHLWTYRQKSGIGRASKKEWINVLEVEPQFLALNDKLREWRFGFEDYYDVYIWDFVPCQTSSSLFNIIIYVSFAPTFHLSNNTCSVKLTLYPKSGAAKCMAPNQPTRNLFSHGAVAEFSD